MNNFSTKNAYFTAAWLINIVGCKSIKKKTSILAKIIKQNTFQNNWENYSWASHKRLSWQIFVETYLNQVSR